MQISNISTLLRLVVATLCFAGFSLKTSAEESKPKPTLEQTVNWLQNMLHNFRKVDGRWTSSVTSVDYIKDKGMLTFSILNVQRRDDGELRLTQSVDIELTHIKKLKRSFMGVHFVSSREGAIRWIRRDPFNEITSHSPNEYIWEPVAHDYLERLYNALDRLIELHRVKEDTTF